jgi:hypothetical protein
MNKEDKIRKEEIRERNEAQNVSRARTGQDRKGEDDYYFAK